MLPSRVAVLTAFPLLPASAAGARGYPTKDADDEEIEAAIRQVHRGRTWLDPAVQARLGSLVTGISGEPSAAAKVRQPPAPTSGTVASGADSPTARETTAQVRARQRLHPDIVHPPDLPDPSEQHHRAPRPVGAAGRP